MKTEKKIKLRKNIRTILLSGIGILLLIFIVVFGIDRAASARNKRVLEEQGYINLVSVGEYDLNVRIFGKTDNPEHIIVGISGLGCTDTSVTFSNCVQTIAEDNLLVLIDRAGYGYSDDTVQEQTVEQIVADYRNGMKQLGMEGPYILMSHSIGGIYATYWENQYPDEVEAMVMLDTTTITGENTFEEEEVRVTAVDYIEAFFSKAGWGRMLYKNYFFSLSDSFSEEQKTYRDMLCANQLTSYAVLSETKLMNENCSFVYEHTQTNDIPKLYICAGYSFTKTEEVREYFEYVNDRMEESGKGEYFDMSDEAHFQEIANLLIDNAAVFREEIVNPYTEKLGCVTQVNIPGDHCIYEQKPKEVGSAIEDFLEGLQER